MEIIAHIYTDFSEKFGIPRQSGLIEELKGKIIFEPKYRSIEAVRGLDAFDYIWLLWEFQNSTKDTWSATVRPPRLKGNKRVGVFATRSPFRPNHIGLSSVKLEKVEITEKGPVLHVAGIDLRDGTPIYDIKPYLAYVDAHPFAKSGFADEVKDYILEVEFPKKLLERLPVQKQRAVIEVLKQDPRPAYHNDPNRKYGMPFVGHDVHFKVEDGKLTVFEVEKL